MYVSTIRLFMFMCLPNFIGPTGKCYIDVRGKADARRGQALNLSQARFRQRLRASGRLCSSGNPQEGIGCIAFSLVRFCELACSFARRATSPAAQVVWLAEPCFGRGVTSTCLKKHLALLQLTLLVHEHDVWLKPRATLAPSQRSPKPNSQSWPLSSHGERWLLRVHTYCKQKHMYIHIYTDYYTLVFILVSICISIYSLVLLSMVALCDSCRGDEEYTTSSSGEEESMT